MPSWVEQLPICWGGLIGWLVGGLLGTLVDVGRMAAHPGTCNPSLASAPLGGACALSFFFSLFTGLLFGSSGLWSLWVLLGTLGPLFANQALHADALLRAYIPYGLHPAFYVAFLTLLVALGGTASRVASLLEQMLPAPTDELPENDTPRKARVDDPPSFLDIRVRDDNEDNKDEDDVFDEEDLPASATVAPPAQCGRTRSLHPPRVTSR